VEGRHGHRNSTVLPSLKRKGKKKGGKKRGTKRVVSWCSSGPGKRLITSSLGKGKREWFGEVPPLHQEKEKKGERG